MSDYDVIAAFIRHLQEQGHPDLTISCYPDKVNRSTTDIDAIAGPFAIEHTSIDTIPNQRRNNDWFKRVTQGLSEEFSDQISFRLTINFYDGSIMRGRDCKKIRQAFKNWISEEKDNPRLAEGPNWINNVPGIPFRFHVIKKYDLSAGVRFGRFPPDSTNLPCRIKNILDRKIEKLKKYKDLGKTTVLLIESNDIALMDIQGRTVLDAIRKAYPFGLPIGIDEIWYVDTAELPDMIGFKNFTSDLLMR